MKIRNLKGQKETFGGILTVLLSVLAVYGIIWSFTDASLFQSSPYSSYVLQAQRWIQGHLDLGQNYPHLELAVFGGKYFVSFPPIPSVLLLPFCLFTDKVPDYLVTTVVGMIGAVYAYKLAYLFIKDAKYAIFWALFITIGSNFLHIGYTGDVWYIAQVCAFTFTMMAFYYAVTPDIRHGWLPVFLLALAVGCRPMQILYLPLMVLLLWQKLKTNELTLKKAVRHYFWWIIPPLAVGVFLMILNYARFGNPFEFGHNYLPEFSTQNEQGQFNFAYLSENLKNMFRLPEYNGERLVFPRFNGVAFWLVSPVFLVFVLYFLKGIRQNWKKPALWMTIILTAVHILALCLHRTLGGWQFGNRYTVDLLPCIYFAVMLMLREDKTDLRLVLYPFFFWGLGINLVGTIALVNGWI